MKNGGIAEGGKNILKKVTNHMEGVVGIKRKQILELSQIEKNTRWNPGSKLYKADTTQTSLEIYWTHHN